MAHLDESLVLVAWGVEFWYGGVQGKRKMPGWLKRILAELEFDSIWVLSKSGTRKIVELYYMN